MPKILLLAPLCLLATILFCQPVMAAKIKCKVISVEGNTVVFDCGKRAKKLHPGATVRVTIKKKDGDGC